MWQQNGAVRFSVARLRPHRFFIIEGERNMLGLVIFLGAIIVIVVAACAANEFSSIAEMKGFSGKKYFWWSFLLGPIGMLMVVALPDRNMKYTSEVYTMNNQQCPSNVRDDDLPTL